MATTFNEYILLTHLFALLGRDDLDKVVGEDADLSVDLALPPALVLDLLAHNVHDLAFGQRQLVVVQGLVAKQHLALFFHWKQKEENKKSVN